MAITLEQVDQVRERANVSYQEAKEALEKTEGDVLEAIVLLESGEEKPFKEKATKHVNDFGNEVIKTLKDLLNSGNVNRIVVEQKDGKVLMNIPVTVGAIGALLLTTATVIALIAALATGCIITIHKESGEVVNVNDMASSMYGTTKEKAVKAYETTKAKAEEVFSHEEKEDIFEEEEKEEDFYQEEVVVEEVLVEVAEEEEEVVEEVVEEDN